jgi:altronate hydrolase
VNGVAKEIEKASQEFVKGSINSIFHLPHQFGCSQLGDDQNNIQRLLVSIALNPNATYVLFIGLGCENNSLQGIKDLLKPYERNNIYFYNAQDVEDEVSYGVNIIKELADKASKLQREEVDIKELCIGLKCGGSDAFSGITANPLVGQISDEIISCGGSAILTEVPEMFGAEQILMNRCESEEIFNKYRDLIVNFKNYYLDLGFPVYENPSPGNKEGGITTLEEKSCGCITKAGESLIVDVLNYGEIIKKDGLNVLNGPGNDLIAATALAASGCQLILFTTGRGTPFSTIVPTLKIATNSLLANRKNNCIDFDASTMDKEGLFNLVISTASGTYKAKQEDNHEIAFFKKGVTL